MPFSAAKNLSTTLPSSTNLITRSHFAISNPQQSFITVPPLNPLNPPSVPNSPLPSANKNNSPNKPTEIPIIEFGQPLPKNL
ncbi:MAG: hypothetical protein ACKPCG_10745 [Dolichospermum sp.]